MIPGMIAVPASAACVSAEVSGRKAYRAASTVPTLTSPQRAVSTCEKGGNALNKSVRSLFASLAIGAILVGSSAVAMAVPVLAQDSGDQQDLTLSVMASQDWIKPAEQELAKQFEAETGIKVDYQIIPSDQYFNVLKTKLNSGEATDIFGGQTGKSDLKLQYDVENNAVDLTAEEWTSRIDPAALDMSSLDGKVYGAEIWDIVASNYFVMVYNKDIFEQLGISVPKDFEEFKAACTTIMDAGITPIYEPIADGWHHVLWFPMVGPAFEEAEPGLADKLNANEATFAGNVNMTTGMSQIDELYQAGCFGDNALSDLFADTNSALASGEYAMSVSPLSTPASIATDFPDVTADTFGFFPIPTFGNQLQPVHPAGPAKFVYAKSPHVEEAKQFLAFLMEPENLQYLLDNTPQFVSLPFPGLEAKWDESQMEFLDTYPAKTIVYQDVVNYLNPQWMDLGKDMVAMFTGGMTPEDVMASIDQRRSDLAMTAGDPAWAQ
jgi:raffinose/stachyose/melibiose transport system substrate-binding protein